MIQHTLEGKPVKKRAWRTRKFLQYYWADCINCGKELKFSIYADAEEFDAKTGKPNWEAGAFTHGEKTCSCGAELLVADDMESVNIYWLNKKDCNSLSEKTSEKP
ncbi:MAG: hypothetical protein WC325_13320 [Candidatus Bathyarchaeia archaeon]|jgi:hypothetical protein